MIDINKAIASLNWQKEPRGLYEPIEYALASGGKRLRPTLALTAAELIVNGHNTGVLWREPFLSPDLLQLLHEGENTIEVNVTNLWVNRMIGDRQKGEIPVTKVRRFYNAGDKLLPSGLLGPVRLMGYK